MRTRIYNWKHIRYEAGVLISSVKIQKGLYEVAVFPLKYKTDVWIYPICETEYLDIERINCSNYFRMLYYHLYFSYKYHCFYK